MTTGSMIHALPYILMMLAVPLEATTYYVSTNGSDNSNGLEPHSTLVPGEGPFLTLSRARDAVRSARAEPNMGHEAMKVVVLPGRYQLSEPLELTEEDSGSEEESISWEGLEDPETDVTISGGRVLAGWRNVTDLAELRRLNPIARDKLVVTNLKNLGLPGFPEVRSSLTWGDSETGVEFFCDGQPMILARWPNSSFTRVSLFPEQGTAVKISSDGELTYDGTRPEHWAEEKAIIAEGFWRYDWADQRIAIVNIDSNTKRISLDPTARHPFGYGDGMYYYVYNILYELDQPGEWYLDRETGDLFFWPPADISNCTCEISALQTLVTLTKTSFLSFRNFTFESAQGTGIYADQVDGILVSKSRIRNMGGWGVLIKGKNSGVQGCDMSNLGNGGILLFGGDRNNLSPSNLFVDNNHIHHYSRWNPINKPAVAAHGVGIQVTNNLVHDAPQQAIAWSGNDNLFAYNEIHSVVLFCNDGGAMYSGRNPTCRGNNILYNYIHDVYGLDRKGAIGIYLDDMYSSANIYGNVFERVGFAVFIGGGNDNKITHNAFLDCKPALHIDSRLNGWAAGSQDLMRQLLDSVPYQRSPWLERFPELMTYTSDTFGVPRGNSFERNWVQGGVPFDIDDVARTGLLLQDNRIISDLSQQTISPESLIKDLGAIPPDRPIGLYNSPNRRSWPVTSTVVIPNNGPSTLK